MKEKKSEYPEEFGMNAWDIREWLKEHNISQNNSFLESDINNA